MGYASKQGRTRIDARSPSASGQCDRCGFLYNHNHLRWQLDYSGAGLYNLRILVCDICYDKPQQQRKVIVIPPDPMPILNARVPDYVNSEAAYRGTYSPPLIDPVTGLPIAIYDYRETNTTSIPVVQEGDILLEDLNGFLMQEDNVFAIALEEYTAVPLPATTYTRVTQQTGEPPGGLDRTPGTNYAVPGDDDPGLPYDNVVVPYTGPLYGE